MLAVPPIQLPVSAARPFVRHLRADHDSDRAGRDHDQGGAAELEDALDVHRDHEEEQGHGEQVSRHPVVDRRGHGDDAQRGRERGDEVAVDHGRGDAEHPLEGRQLADPENGGEDGGQIAEYGHRLLDKGGHGSVATR
jgi:hypothetical protein